MRKYMIATITLTACLSIISGKALGAGPFEIGISFDIRGTNLKSEVIPEQVKEEAANPWIINPYSGHYFGKDTIGAYDPTETFIFVDGGLYVKYTVPIKFPVRPYFRTELQYPILASTHKGYYNQGYSYFKLLATSGVDYVGYFYGIEYKYKYFIEPELGVSYVKESSFSLSFGVSYQKLELNYYKGIEAYGVPGHYQKLGSSTHNLFNYKFNFTKFFNGFSFSVEPSLTFCKGIDGYAVAFSIQKNF